MASVSAPQRRQWTIVALFVGIVVLQLVLGAISVDVLSAVRAYVGGESLWSKAQKDAWFYSTRFSESYAEEDYQQFRNALAVPLADRRAREELDRPDADLSIASAGFLEGRNHADDVPGMIRLYRWFHDVPFMADAIAIWAKADGRVAELASLVDRAHERIAAGDLMSPAVRALVTRLPELNEELTALERQFSARLGDASRKTQGLLLAVNLALAALMTLAGLRFARRTLHEQANADRALRESHERWEVAADMAGLGLFDWHVASGKLTLDARACALYGIDSSGPSTIDSRQPGAAVHPDDAPRVREAVRAAAAEGRPVVARYRVTGRDGTLRHLELIGLATDWDVSSDRRMKGIVRDISDDVQAEQMRLDKLAAERASQAKSEFLARISHELRTPLNAILGFGQLMQIDDVDRLSAEHARRVEHVLHGGHYLLRLVDDILSLTALESSSAAALEMRALRTSAVVASSIQHVAHMAAARGIELAVAAPDSEVTLLGDAVRLEQLLVNLLTNAIKYNRPAGRVTVSWSAEGAWVPISVQDTGAGLTTEQVARLFQPFNRLGAEYSQVEGTGLGLVIVRELVQRMGGTVQASSQPGVGSCFVVRLRMARSS